MEVTYSQDLIIRDQALLATLSIFCNKTYLPYQGVANDLCIAAAGIDDSIIEKVNASLAVDSEVAEVKAWMQEHDALFREGALEMLPVHRFREHRHRNLDNTNEKLDEMYPNLRRRGLFAGLALNLHCIRDDLPGIELFESGHSGADIRLARSVFFVEVPKISAKDDELCDIRKAAQVSGLKDFWRMIEQQIGYASDESSVTRAEKIRKDFTEWQRDHWVFRGESIAVMGLVTLCFLHIGFAPLASLAAAKWIGEANRRWAERKSITHNAFKFISTIDGKIQRLED